MANDLLEKPLHLNNTIVHGPLLDALAASIAAAGAPGNKTYLPFSFTLVLHASPVWQKNWNGGSTCTAQGHRACRSAELGRRVAKRLPRLPRSPNRIAQNRS